MSTYPAIAVIEFASIADGIYCTDALLKKAPIAMIKSGTVSRGRYLVIIGGSTASVEESLNEALAAGHGSRLDHAFLPDVHPQLHEAILGQRQPVAQQPLHCQCLGRAAVRQAQAARANVADGRAAWGEEGRFGGRGEERRGGTRDREIR